MTLLLLTPYPTSRSNLRSFGPLLWPSWVIHQFQDLSCACAHPVPSAPSSEQPESFLASFLSSHLKYNVPSWSPLALWQNQTPSSVLLQHTMCVNIPQCMVMQSFVYIYLNLLPRVGAISYSFWWNLGFKYNQQHHKYPTLNLGLC